VRILYHHRTLADGAEGIHIAAMVDAFRRLGHEVHVASLAGAARGGRLIDCARSALPRAVAELASLGVNVPEYLQVRRQLEVFDADLLYKRHARHDIAALAAARRCKIPAVLEVNALFTAPGYEQFEPITMAGLARSLERRALQMSNVVIVVSSPLAREVEALSGVNAIVLPNGVDPDRFDPRRANGSRVRARYGLGGALTIGWTGILREWHGLELLLDALVSVPAAQLLIVGDGPARSRLDERVLRSGLQQRVVVTGRVPHDEIPDYLAAIDIAVVADERTGVASPMKLVEYMSMGRAVVAPAEENIRDLVEDGVDGLLFRPGDGDQLAALLRRLAGDLPLRRALGSHARNKVEQERNWQVIAAKVLDTVERAKV
jgi:glycosyltransferase involved in cell wall biosynthesis